MEAHQMIMSAPSQGGAGKSVWVIDHCHTTDKFRGFLCHNCNRGIGVFKDDLKRLHRAVRYLKGLSGRDEK